MKRNFHAVLFAFFAILFSSASIMAQEKGWGCITDQMVKKSLDANPELKAQFEARQIEKAMTQTSPASEAMATIYYVPVVFHILHNYGAENISDAQIIDQMNILNRDFRKLNADTTDIISQFQGIAADTEIEFRLATKDPNGNCTNGIDRIPTMLTYYADDDAKLNNWPRNKYLNIWVASSLVNAGAAAYAYLPGSAPNGIDGIMIRSHYVGSIGTSSVAYSRVLTHEVGHYLDLLHVWGGSNSPEVACGDDGVSDTPETMGHTFCDISSSICNPPIIENVQNYMEYAYCEIMFTAGQRQRMRSALNSSDGQRNQLITASNATATGIFASPVPVCAPIADFSTTNFSVCAGGNVIFSDATHGGDPTTWNWDFTGGSPASSVAQNPIVSYPNPGTYSVSLTAANGTGSSTKSKTAIIEVFDPNIRDAAPLTEGFEETAFPPSGWSTINYDAGTNTWIETSAAKYSGLKSMKINNHSTTSSGQRDVIATNLYDFSTSSTKVLTFRLAYCQTNANDNDELVIYMSTNCGATWGVRYSKAGATLATRSIKSSSFTPTAATDWRLETISMGAYQNAQNVRMKFEFRSGGGNNLYIDDIAILGYSGAEEISDAGFFAGIFPNPVTNQSTLQLELPAGCDFSYGIFDVTGKLLSEIPSMYLPSGNHEFPFSQDMEAGIYFVQLRAGDKTATRKIMVVH